MLRCVLGLAVTFGLLLGPTAGCSLSQSALSYPQVKAQETRVPEAASPTATAMSTELPTPTPVAEEPTSTPPSAQPTQTPSPTPEPTQTPTPLPSAELRPLPVVLVEEVASSTPDPQLAEVISRTLAGRPGHLGVVVKHLLTGQSAELNADDVVRSASLYKVALMYQLFADRAGGRLSFDSVVTATAEISQTLERLGLPELSYPLSSTVTIGRAMQDMIILSDNTAALMLWELAGGWRVNKTMDDLGLGTIELGEEVRTSTRHIAGLLEVIASGRAVDRASSEEMLQLLAQQVINDRLPRLLPAGVAVAHKTGNWAALRNDAGIVYGPSGPYLIAVLASDLEDEEAGSQAIADLSRAVFDYFNPAYASLPPR